MPIILLINPQHCKKVFNVCIQADILSDIKRGKISVRICHEMIFVKIVEQVDMVTLELSSLVHFYYSRPLPALSLVITAIVVGRRH